MRISNSHIKSHLARLIALGVRLSPIVDWANARLNQYFKRQNYNGAGPSVLIAMVAHLFQMS